MKEVVPALSANSSQFINNTRQQQHKTNISHQQLRQFMTCLIGKLIEAYTQPERLYYHLLRCVCVLLSRSGSVWMPGAIFTKYLLFIRYWIYITQTCISVILINRLIASQNAQIKSWKTHEEKTQMNCPHLDKSSLHPGDEETSPL